MKTQPTAQNRVQISTDDKPVWVTNPKRDPIFSNFLVGKLEDGTVVRFYDGRILRRKEAAK
jgi:hypothetical protein